jgi:competence protein ComEA
LISINQATQDELETLLGIGPTKALGIISYRDEYGGFKALEELTEVKGIGPATFAKIKDFIRL